MTRTLCSQCIDPMTIEPFVANRLIPLDKGEGAVRPSLKEKFKGEFVESV